MPDIELQIDELVLHGFPATDRARIGDAVHAELVRNLEQLGDRAGRLAALDRIGALDAGTFSVTAGAKPQAIGAQIAQSIVGSAAGGGAKR
jgi:hypothetical protein